MTTIPGHNQMLQQSGIAQELSQQAHSPKPSPDQAAVIQQAQEVMENFTMKLMHSQEMYELAEKYNLSNFSTKKY